LESENYASYSCGARLTRPQNVVSIIAHIIIGLLDV
jgi:hypothetical protein